MMDEIWCPACGRELGWLDEVYRRESCRVVEGCSRCFGAVNAVEWAEENAEEAWINLPGGEGM